VIPGGGGVISSFFLNCSGGRGEKKKNEQIESEKPCGLPSHAGRKGRANFLSGKKEKKTLRGTLVHLQQYSRPFLGGGEREKGKGDFAKPGTFCAGAGREEGEANFKNSTTAGGERGERPRENSNDIYVQAGGEEKGGEGKELSYHICVGGEKPGSSVVRRAHSGYVALAKELRKGRGGREGRENWICFSRNPGEKKKKKEEGAMEADFNHGGKTSFPLLEHDREEKEEGEEKFVFQHGGEKKKKGGLWFFF